jgi:cytochrome b
MQKRLVWDLPVRLFHWLLVASLLLQWLSAEIIDDAMDIHFYNGYFLLGLILFRFIWGFIGTRHARFSQFICSPNVILAYLKNLFSQNYVPSTGHNPLGGLMLPAVLLLVAIQGTSGLFTSDDIVHSGPYYQSVSDTWQSIFQWLHHTTFNLIWAVVAIHLAAIGLYTLKFKHDLVSPMLHGKKAVAKQDAIPHSQLLKALILAIGVAVFFYWLVEIAAPIPTYDYY